MWIFMEISSIFVYIRIYVALLVCVRMHNIIKTMNANEIERKQIYVVNTHMYYVHV